MNTLINVGIITTITTLEILFVKYIFKNQMSAKLHYYIWAILIIRLVLVPIAPKIELNSSVINHTIDISNLNNVEESKKDIALSNEDISNISSNDIVNFNYNIVKIIKNNMLEIWAVGSGMLLLYFFSVYTIFNIKIHSIPMCTDETIKSILKICKEKVGIKREIVIKLHTGTSMANGILLPTIFLNSNNDNEEIQQIIIHELFHIKNNDIIVTFFSIIFLCINWYNPIIWICFFTLKSDMELLCDQRVISIVKNKKSYSKLLMKSALDKNKGLLISPSIQGGKREIKRRILFMANYKKNSKLFRGAIALAIASICIGSMITPTVNASTIDNTIKYETINNKSSEQEYEIVKPFIDSITYDASTQTLSFVVPKEIPEKYKWFVHISGHEQYGNGPGTFHLFEDESYNYTWESGKRYEYAFKENPLIGCSFIVGIVNQNISHDIQGQMIVNIDKNGAIVKNKYENYEAVNKLISTIAYDNSAKTISLTVPENIPEGYKWYMHVSGHEQLSDGTVVFHAFEDETYGYKWEAGKTYTYTLQEGSLINCSFDLGLKNENSNYIENDTTIVVNGDGTISHK